MVRLILYMTNSYIVQTIKMMLKSLKSFKTEINSPVHMNTFLTVTKHIYYKLDDLFSNTVL